MDVLFVTGCSRSGTTALVDVLNAHEAIVVGMERYKHLYPQTQAEELQGLFDVERFFDFRSTDTSVLPGGRNQWYRLYEDARGKLATGSVVFIGDKPKAAPSIAEKLTQAYPEARWIHIFRELAYVAASFEARANAPHDRWPLRAGYRDALRQWTEGFRAAELLCRRGAAITRLPRGVRGVLRERRASTRLAARVPRSPAQPDAAGARPADHWQLGGASRPPRLFQAALEWLDAARPAEVEDRFRQLARRDHEAWLSAARAP